MPGDQRENLRWQDLSSDDVYHIAHIENEARDEAPQEVEEITRRWLDMQQVIRAAQPDRSQPDRSDVDEADEKDSRSTAPETADGSSDLQRPIGIPQPEDSPVRAPLTVPSSFVQRYGSMETRLKRRPEAPSQLFIAAAVMYDEDQQIADSEIAKLARGLAAADKHIKENPGAPVLVVSRVYLQAGNTAADGGLYFKNYGSPGISNAVVIVPCESRLEADVDTQDPASVTPSMIGDGPTQGMMDFLTPRHVLTPDNISKASETSHHFLEEPILIVGQGVAKAFFNSLLSKKRGSKGAEQRRVVAEQAVNLLTGRSGNPA